MYLQNYCCVSGYFQSTGKSMIIYKLHICCRHYTNILILLTSQRLLVKYPLILLYGLIFRELNVEYHLNK